MKKLMTVIPIVFACVGGTLVFASTHPSFVANSFAYDSVKVKFEWQQPQDGRGNADSTLFRLRLSKQWKRFTDTIIRQPNTWYRIARTTQLSDSVKLALTIPGDSVIFEADSIRQCRRGVCSVPGSASFRYIRPDNPPPMTFLRIITDSMP